ncbi:MAG: NADH:flavin oxidoreductase/NADH oxidase family protein [Luminiphilus sp.]|jgi:2,4-dienoyl-CoA reductase-like NADH-dependent reductase (Old Yellow Enzyme family)|nr:NADH:flavin oxidoreductase/NADH oxidase family protein [Luminiphilus sp.]
MIHTPLTLPCGAQISNRLCKAAMTEGLAAPTGEPTEELNQLYGLWSDGGAGLLLSGNVQMDGDHLERPGNVIVDSEPSVEMKAALERWAKAGTRGGNHFWAQISHAGRQCQKIVNPRPKAPSAIKLGLPGGQFGEPDPMTEEDIEAVITGFARCAKVVVNAGFTGVQLHAAHGYLLSQFLSPRSNRREDQWGGSLENRARLLLRCVARVRAALGPMVPVSVKLNSADFQRGGFDFNESLQVAKWLEEASVDLIEISGGTYEQPRLLNLEGMEPVAEQSVPASTRAREAYFVDFAEAMRQQINIPLMVTGGLRRLDAMNEALEAKCADMIGIGRPMCVVTDAPRQLLDGVPELPRFEDTLSLLPKAFNFLNRLKLVRTVGAFATQYWFYEQIAALGRTGSTQVAIGVMAATKAQTKAANTWLSERKAALAKTDTVSV